MVILTNDMGELAIAASLYDDFAPEVGVAKANVGVVLRAQGRTAEAMKVFKDVKLVFETEAGDVRVVPALVGLSELVAATDPSNDAADGSVAVRRLAVTNAYKALRVQCKLCIKQRFGQVQLERVVKSVKSLLSK